MVTRRPMTITITLPDGSTREQRQGVMRAKSEASTVEAWPRPALASARHLRRWCRRVTTSTAHRDEARVAIITPDSDDAVRAAATPTAHVMAQE